MRLGIAGSSNGEGTLSRPELQLIIGAMAEKLTETDILALVDEVDENGDGVIDFEEFAHLMIGSDSMKL